MDQHTEQLDTTPPFARRFGRQREVFLLTGRTEHTLAKDRQKGVGLPYYRCGKSILYDLDEVEALILATRVAPAAQ